jgi:DNA integrity scanning protein DisA with diadenylate cyclase activity
VTRRRSEALLNALAAVAPGKPLREGLDRILQAGMGALIVVSDGPEVLNICSGGFLLDAAFSPQRLSELAKMDGAIILAGDASRIARANVHLERAHVRDRHPAPHRRAGRSVDQHPRHLGVGGHVDHRGVRR